MLPMLYAVFSTYQAKKSTASRMVRLMPAGPAVGEVFTKRFGVEMAAMADGGASCGSHTGGLGLRHHAELRALRVVRVARARLAPEREGGGALGGGGGGDLVEIFGGVEERIALHDGGPRTERRREPRRPVRTEPEKRGRGEEGKHEDSHLSSARDGSSPTARCAGDSLF